MRAATRQRRPQPTDHSQPRRHERFLPVAVAVSGPVLIVGAVITVYHGYVFHDVLTSRHVDMLPFYLPNYCFLGETLRAGHIALWNPYTLSGTPFAADPLSGWMNLPAMLTFAALPCGTAMRVFIVLQPVIAGLGMYWFLRGETLSRIAATVGGLVLALSIAGSLSGITLSFAGILAWMPIMLGAESRCLRARTWPRRLAWCVLTALAWGQVVASFLTTGIILGTLALVAFGIAVTVSEVRGGTLSRAGALTLGAIVSISLPTINLAYLLPRLAYLPRTSLSLGYEQLRELADRYSHVPLTNLPPEPHPGVAAWPLNLMAPPGAYIGATAVVLAFAVWGSKRLRLPVAALAAFGALGYLLTLPGVPESLGRLVGSRAGSILVHNGGRDLFAVIFALSASAGFGMQSWLETSSVRRRSILLVPGVAVLAVLPFVQGIDISHLLLPLIAGAAALALLIASGPRTALAVVVPLLVAVELGANAFLGQASLATLKISAGHPYVLYPQRSPNVDAAAYIRPTSLVTALRAPGSGRYISFDPTIVTYRGYLGRQDPASWGLLANQRGVLFHVEDADGYNSMQLLRYWSFVRAVTSRPLNYNVAAFQDPKPVTLDLLQVNGLIVRSADPPLLPLPSRPIAAEGGWQLDRLEKPFARVSVLPSWRVVSTEDQALQAVTAPGFDPSSTAILERSPELSPSDLHAATAGSAAYEPLGLQSARISVTTPSPAIVLVRTPYDQNWHASVDGQPAPLLAADYVVQGVPVGAGSHTILLSYRDPTIGLGLAGSVAGTGSFFGVAILLAIRSRRARRPPPSADHPLETSPADGEGEIGISV